MHHIPYLSLGKVNALCQEEIDQAVMNVVHSGQYLYGEQVSAFRKSWAKYNEAKYCVTTANGLDALTASLMALKILRKWPDQSEVIVSGLTFIASFEAISRVGLTPVPVDVNETDYLMNPDLAEKAITEKTVAMMPVNIYGRNTDMQPYRAIADKHGLAIVVDACQMHGNPQIVHPSTQDNVQRGNDFSKPLIEYCDAAAYSFYPGKNLGAFGDAGCLITNNPDLADTAEMYCNYGSKKKYHHLIQGVNSRMDDIQAAILNAKLPHLDESNALRRKQAGLYNRCIHNALITLPYGGKDEEQSVWHIYPVFTNYRAELIEYLAQNGIQALIHYPIPPHKQQAYKELNHMRLPVSERLCQTEVSLPLNPALTEQEQRYIINTLNKFEGKTA